MIDKVFDVRSFPHTPIRKRILAQVDGCFDKGVRGKLKTHSDIHCTLNSVRGITCFSRNNKRRGKKNGNDFLRESFPFQYIFQ